MSYDDDEATFEDVQVHVAALAYYLYRQVGCPMGDNLSGYKLWMETSLIEPFNKLSKHVENDDQPTD